MRSWLGSRFRFRFRIPYLRRIGNTEPEPELATREPDRDHGGGGDAGVVGAGDGAGSDGLNGSGTTGSSAAGAGFVDSSSAGATSFFLAAGRALRARIDERRRAYTA